MRAASVRFYFDEDVLGLAKVVARLRSDCTFPGDAGAVTHGRVRPPCPVIRGTADTTWLPAVAARDWLVVTRDFRISENPAERRAVRENGAKLVALAGSDAGSVWGQLEVLMSRWRDLESLATAAGPFVFRATRSRLTAIDLDR